MAIPTNLTPIACAECTSLMQFARVLFRVVGQVAHKDFR